MVLSPRRIKKPKRRVHPNPITPTATESQRGTENDDDYAILEAYRMILYKVRGSLLNTDIPAPTGAEASMTRTGMAVGPSVGVRAVELSEAGNEET